MEVSGSRCYCALICSSLLCLCTGSLNSFGTFSIYYASYYYPSHSDNALVRTCFFPIFPVACVVEGLAFSAGIALAQRFGFRVPLLLSGVMTAGSYMLVAVVASPDVFAGLCALGMGGSGGCYIVCSLEVWKHFKSHYKGRVMSVLSAAYGFGTMLWSFLFSFLCNPSNLPPTIHITQGAAHYNLFTDSVAHRVPYVSCSVGCLFLAVFLLVVLIYPSAPHTDSHVSLLESIAAYSADVQVSNSTCPNLRSAIRSWPFWSLSLNMFCSLLFGVFIVNVYKNYGLTKYDNDHLMSTIGSIAASLGGISRVFFSAAMDHFSFRVLYGVNITLQVVTAATITYALNTDVYLYGVCVSIGFSMFCGVFASFILEVNRLFGNK